MISFIKKWSPWEIVLLLFSVALFLATRLYHLQSRFWPIFTDEAIYVRWAQQGFFEPVFRLTSLSDGKQPLFIWLITILMQVVGNPLMAGRLVSVGSGLITLAGLYFLSKELFKRRLTALVAIFLYTLFPLALIHNRYALYESLVGAIFIWSVYLSVLLAKNLKTETAFELGLVLGAGILTKTSGFVSFYLVPTTLIFLEKAKKNIFRWAGLFILAMGLSYLYFSVLLLSPDFASINDKNNIFLYSLNEVLRINLLSIFFNNITQFVSWLISYFTLPFVILSALSFFIKKNRKEIFFLWLTFGIPFLALAVLGKLVYPRYLFFFSIALLPLIAESLTWLSDIFKKNKINYVIIFFSIIFASFSDFKILTDFARAPIPAIDLFQYVNGWPAGGGISEMINYFQAESSKQIIYVYSEGIYGSLPTTAIEIYFRDNANVKHKGLGELPAEMPEELRLHAQKSPVYLVLNELAPPPWPLELINQYQKGIGNWYLRIYRVKLPL